MIGYREWWAVVHVHNGQPCCTDGQAALFETKRRALRYKNERGRIVGLWNVRIVKVTVSRP